MTILKRHFDIINGDVITLTLNTETGQSIFTSARGDYRLEEWFSLKFLSIVQGIVEHETGHKLEFETQIIRDHDDPPLPLDLP